MNCLKILTIILLNIFLFSHNFSKDSVKEKENEIREQIKKLGDSNYKVRDKAIKELNNLPYTHRKILVQEFKATTNLEIRDRLKSILDLSNDGLIEYFSEFYLKSQKLNLDKKYNEALIEINKIIAIDDEYLMALILKSQILLNKGDYKDCIEVLKKLLLLQSNEPNEVEKININLSQIYIDLGEFKNAIELLESLLANKKNAFELKDLLLQVYEQDKQFEKTELLLIKEISERPELPQLENSLAWFYIRNGKLEKGKTIIKEKLANIKNSPITTTLNNLFIENYDEGIKFTKQKTKSFFDSLKGKKDVNIIDLDNQDVYFLLFQHFFETANNQQPSTDFKGLYKPIRAEDLKVWPYPLLGYYASEITLANLNNLLEDANPMQARQKKCEAYFFLGLLKLSEKNNAEAKKLFQLCVDQKIWSFVETTAAIYMLQKI